jgi:hypothetical protein
VNREGDRTVAAIRSGFQQTPWYSSRYGRPAIDDQEDHALCSGDQAFEKFEENTGVDAALSFDHEGTARRLSIDGDDTGRRSRHRRGHSGEALLELLGVERGENFAQMIVRVRAVVKEPEPAREQREQAQQQDSSIE